jgi:hypothetical protein
MLQSRTCEGYLAETGCAPFSVFEETLDARRDARHRAGSLPAYSPLIAPSESYSAEDRVRDQRLGDIASQR